MNSPTTFGVMREILPRERRVALTPDGTERLIAAGHAVIMETGAGKAAGFDDDDYRAMGTTIALSNREVSLAADVLVKVHGPGPSEVDLLPHGGFLGAREKS